MVAVVYFSHPGETLFQGKIKAIRPGNTAEIAHKIGRCLRVTPVAILSRKGYPFSYQQTLAVAKQQLIDRTVPEIISCQIDLSDKVLFLGYPNWWGGLPRPVVSFLRQQSFLGVTIYPFCTHEGNRFGHSLAQLQQLVPTATIYTSGLPVRGSQAQHADEAVSNWLARISIDAPYIAALMRTP